MKWFLNIIVFCGVIASLNSCANSTGSFLGISTNVDGCKDDNTVRDMTFLETNLKSVAIMRRRYENERKASEEASRQQEKDAESMASEDTSPQNAF